MKNLLNNTLFLLLMSVVFLVSSCDTNDAPEPDVSVIEEDAEATMAFEDLDNLTLTVLSNSGFSARTTREIPAGDICEGALVNVDEENKMITVDFGDGCTSPSGVTRKGIVMLSYTGNLLFNGAKIITTFDGYEVDGLKVEGTRTITNQGGDLETNTINLEVKVQNGKVTWSDGTSVSFNSDQVRAVKLGTQGDYQATINGTASGTSRGGYEYTSSITDELVYTKSCIESGVSSALSGMVAFQFRGIEASVDYGNGECDNMATINYPGGSKQVTLD